MVRHVNHAPPTRPISGLLALGLAAIVACGSPKTSDQRTGIAPSGRSTRDTGAGGDDVTGASDIADDSTDATPGDSGIADLSATDADTPDGEPVGDTPSPDVGVDVGADTASTDAPVDTVDTRSDPPPDVAPPDVLTVVVHATDVWGQSVPDIEVEVIGPDDRVRRLDAGAFAPDVPGRYTVACTAPDHRDSSVDFDWNGGIDANAVSVTPDPTDTRALTIRRVSERSAGPATINLHVGLHHAWFAASGRPARRGNRARFLMNGEETWRLVRERFEAATDRIHISTWWWQSDFELTRSEAILDERTRRSATIVSILDRSPATARVLVWDSFTMGWFNVDGALDDRGAARTDGFEYMPQENPTSGRFRWDPRPWSFTERIAADGGLDASDFDDDALVAPAIEGRNVDLTDFPVLRGVEISLASYHQKFFVVDGDEAFISGMNMKSTDWDTNEHAIFDHRRMRFESDEDDRLAVREREEEPDHRPRRDYTVYLHGPVARDLDDTFRQRWDLQIDERAEYSANATRFDLRDDLAPLSGGVQAQVVNTMPEPFGEYAILESHLNAINNAERYILIEDQYWRAPIILDALLDRMAAVRELQLIVVTPAIDEWTDPGCEWTARMHDELRGRFPSRYATFRLRSFDYVETWGFDETEARWADIDLHSKLMIIDDRFLSVGSCNKNNRGYIYEGETNVNVFDRAFVTEARERVVANLLGSSFTPFDWLAEVRRQADRNERVWDAWEDA